MKGYKILRESVSGPMYLCEDNKTFDSTGFTWKKRNSAEKVMSCFQQKGWGLSIVEINIDDIQTKLTNSGKTIDAVFDEILPSNLASAVRQVSDKMDDLSTYQKYLNECLSLEDKVTSDLLHYIELNDDEDEEKMKEVYMLLKQSRKKRRDVKDKIKMLNSIKNNCIDDVIDSLNKCRTSIDERYYSPKTDVLDKFNVTLR